MDEHFTPEPGLTLDEYVRRGDIGAAHHLVRYLWFLEAADGGREILDLGCGAGYGAHLVARRFPDSRVLAVDYDAKGIEEARRSYSAPNLRFAVADAMSWTCPDLDRTFDTVISFDSIEHVPHRELVMEHVVEHLASDGGLYLSTPCGAPVNEL